MLILNFNVKIQVHFVEKSNFFAHFRQEPSENVVAMATREGPFY